MRSAKVIYRKNPLFDKCPACSAKASMRRSHARSAAEKVFNKLTFYKTYRCKGCGWRGYLPTLTISFNSLIGLLIYSILIIAASFITLFLIKKLL